MSNSLSRKQSTGGYSAQIRASQYELDQDSDFAEYQYTRPQRLSILNGGNVHGGGGGIETIHNNSNLYNNTSSNIIPDIRPTSPLHLDLFNLLPRATSPPPSLPPSNSLLPPLLSSTSSSSQYQQTSSLAPLPLAAISQQQSFDSNQQTFIPHHQQQRSRSTYEGISQRPTSPPIVHNDTATVRYSSRAKTVYSPTVDTFAAASSRGDFYSHERTTGNDFISTLGGDDDSQGEDLDEEIESFGPFDSSNRRGSVPFHRETIHFGNNSNNNNHNSNNITVLPPGGRPMSMAIPRDGSLMPISLTHLQRNGSRKGHGGLASRQASLRRGSSPFASDKDMATFQRKAAHRHSLSLNNNQPPDHEEKSTFETAKASLVRKASLASTMGSRLVSRVSKNGAASGLVMTRESVVIPREISGGTNHSLNNSSNNTSENNSSSEGLAIANDSGETVFSQHHHQQQQQQLLQVHTPQDGYFFQPGKDEFDRRSNSGHSNSSTTATTPTTPISHQMFTTGSDVVKVVVGTGVNTHSGNGKLTSRSTLLLANGVIANNNGSGTVVSATGGGGAVVPPESPLTRQEEAQAELMMTRIAMNTIKWHTWTKSKMILLAINTMLFIYSTLATIVMTQAYQNQPWTREILNIGIMTVANRLLLNLMLIVGPFGLFISLLGFMGIFQQSRKTLSIYNCLLWPLFGFICAVGYVAYRRSHMALYQHLKFAWIYKYDRDDRLVIQHALNCCGFRTNGDFPSYDLKCFPKTPLVPCEEVFFDYQQQFLGQTSGWAFILVPFQLMVMVGALLTSNHVDRLYRSGNPAVPKMYTQ